MVGPLTVFKMLHCSSLRDIVQKENPNRAGTSHNEIENNELCRVCLREGKMPIFGLNASEDIVGALNTIGGVEVSIDDFYPKYLCQPCYALLQGAILFRKTAQLSDQQLKMTTKKEYIETYDINNFAEDSEVPSRRKAKTRKFLECKRCDIQFDSYQEYSDHRISDEHENRKIVCSICNNSYYPEYIKRHMEYHKAETSYICDVCGKHFTRQEHFSRHRLTHSYSLPFQCSLCPYKGRFTESLRMHMRSHTGEKPYQCDKCPRRFINKSNLNKHALTHKGEHDFRCEVCGRGFYTKRELDMHFKVIHAGIKEHICPICDKAFGYRKQMMKHQLKVHKRAKLKSGRTPIYIQIEQMNQQKNPITSETLKII